MLRQKTYMEVAVPGWAPLHEEKKIPVVITTTDATANTQSRLDRACSAVVKV